MQIAHFSIDKMKLLVFLCLIAAVSAEWYDDVDWTQVRTRDIVLNQDTSTFSRVGRIVGGKAADQNQFPYQAGVLIFTLGQTYFCGGGLLTTKYVITAAHCLEIALEVQVRLGAQNVMTQEVNQQRFVSRAFSIHPDYNSTTINQNIGLIKLPVAATLTVAVQTVRLPTWTEIDYTFNGLIATVMGWGVDADNSQTISPTLRFLETPIISNLACRVGFLGQLLETHICTTGAGNIGACTGDAGGCVVVDGKLVGIISFVLSFSCQAGWPSGHSRITSAMNWIHMVTNVPIQP